ncbi:TetR/AcrR family transcriptional regulator [Agreia sp. COWG]|uniref:TetR/AcrR family transcriptional regulator n=1 Tax=Agreia sp. COWG TaxID=2773266 RepID=UPI001925AC73|nr:TetR/AcrR family transcriptional regulator [Agreia sp. COWG]CAD6010546.1 Transcriptional regulator, TetR family [Agreia sp. COWG]
MHDSPLGLRERKRAQTAEAIHVAAAELALERGLEATTIDAISERADVSPRTFFNYFPTKEDAVLGIDEAAVAAELDREREHDPDILVAVFDLIYAVFEASGGNHRHAELKRAVMRENPQLMTRQMVRVADLEDRLSGIIALWLADDASFSSGSDANRRDDARLILGVCLATVRSAMKKWATGPDTSDASNLRTDTRKHFVNAVSTFKTVMEKLV